ncbi:MAG: hypothetical protein JXN65_11010 [Clostridia bacterium]|nr:hypothetical protein [Clostridia bacterium]
MRNTKITKQTYYALILLILLSLYVGFLSANMGISHFFSSIMNTAYRLLIDTALYILAISVVMGAFGNMLMEFGIVNLLNKIFAPLMKPLYGLPGASFLGIMTSYFSDNPAIIVLANDKKYIKYFKKEQVPCLCNLGTSFGMGLILTTYMIGQGFIIEPIIGNIGAIIGSVVSVRLLNFIIKRKKYFDTYKPPLEAESADCDVAEDENISEGFMEKMVRSMLDGGKSGVEMGLKIIPGLLIICTIVMTLTFGVADPSVGYQGAAYEGVALLPKLGDIFSPVLTPLYGFTSSEAIAFPITALGAVGAAMSLVPKMLGLGLISGNDIAVFTAIGMCWSGYLSTHVGMMDALRHRKLVSSSILSHTIGGLAAGAAAHYLYMLFM